MNYQQIATPKALAEFLMEVGQPTPKSVKEIAYPFVMPYEVVSGDNVEPEYILHHPVSLQQFELDEWQKELVAIEVWYREYSKKGHDADGYKQLLQARDRLADCITHLGKAIASANNIERDVKYERDTKLAKLKGIYRQDGLNADTAKYKALKDCKEEVEFLSQAVFTKEKLKAQLESSKLLHNSMAGVRSTLESEKYQANRRA